jgi:hypothetical protein
MCAQYINASSIGGSSRRRSGCFPDTSAASRDEGGGGPGVQGRAPTYISLGTAVSDLV